MSKTKTKESPVRRALLTLHSVSDAFAEKVAPLYVALAWKWSFPEGCSRIPTLDDIHGVLFSLLGAVETQLRRDEESADASTGGLTVRVYKKGGLTHGVFEFTVRDDHMEY